MCYDVIVEENGSADNKQFFKIDVKPTIWRNCWLQNAGKGRKMSRKEEYTDRAFYESLMELLKKEAPEKISVTKLCEKADLNRATFYARYYSMGDYYTKIAQQQVEAILRRASEEIGQRGVNHETIKKTVIDSVRGLKEATQLRVLWKYIDRPKLYDEIFRKTIPEEQETEELKLLFCFLMNGAAGVCEKWLEEGSKTPTEVLAEDLTIVIEELFHAALPRLTKKGD